ncbi:MAG TPA: hypothetical protein VE054_01830, partial [Blattabacteriaceae bacterium]|nr:hypothetical protein [Blattabacteriaceae bacterium]
GRTIRLCAELCHPTASAVKIRPISVIRGGSYSLFPQIRVHPRKSAVRIFFAPSASFAVKALSADSW